MAPLEIAVPWRSSKSASPLQCALLKNVSLSPVESALKKSLDLISPEMNTYGKGGDLLAFCNLRLPIGVHQCSSVVALLLPLACLCVSLSRTIAKALPTGAKCLCRAGNNFGCAGV